VNHDQLQSHVEQLFEQPSRAAVARRAVSLVETVFEPSTVGFYNGPDSGTELLTATGTTLPSSLAGILAVDRAVDTGAPITGTPPPSLSRHESWCCVSTGGEGLLVAADSGPDAFDRRDERRLSQFAVGVGAALRAVDVTPSTDTPTHEAVGETDGGTTEELARDSPDGPESDPSTTEQPLFRAIEGVYPDYAFLHDRDGRYLDAVLGYQNTPLNRRSELLGETVADVLPPTPAETILEAIRRVVDTGTSETITYTLDTPAGDRLFESVVIPVTVDGADRAVLVARDVTEREQRRRDRTRMETWTEFALETTNSLVWCLDLETERIEWPHGGSEPVAPASHGYEWTLSEYLDEAVSPDDRERLTRVVDRLLSGDREELHVEYRTVLGAGDERWIAADGVVHDEADGRRLIGLAREITDRKRRERRLTALHEAVGDIADASSVTEVCRETVRAGETALDLSACLVAVEEDGVFVPEATGTAVSADDYELKSTEAGVAGWTFRNDESLVVADQQTHDLAQTDGDGTYRSLLSVPIGDHGVLQVGAAQPRAFDDQDRQLAELLANHAAVALDRLSSRRRLEARNDRLEEFTSLVSHDLRNPLEVAMGHVELAKTRPDDARSHLQTVAEAHERIDELIDEVLALARTGTAELTPESVAVEGVARQCWTLVDTSEATLRVTADRTITADPGHLRRLFENLFRNAVEHGGASVTVTVGELPDGFYVADDGSGLAPDEHERIFEPGYSSRQSGTGFGLSIVRSVARDHGWTVDVTESDAGGARFELRDTDT